MEGQHGHTPERVDSLAEDLAKLLNMLGAFIEQASCLAESLADLIEYIDLIGLDTSSYSEFRATIPPLTRSWDDLVASIRSRNMVELREGFLQAQEASVAFGRSFTALCPDAIEKFHDLVLASGENLDEYLRFILDREPDAEDRTAFYHVVTRPPRIGNEYRWRQRAREDVEHFRRYWLPCEVRGEAQRRREEGGNTREREFDDDIVESPFDPALLGDPLEIIRELDGASGITPREWEMLEAVAAEDTLAAASEYLGIAPGTGRNLVFKIKKKLKIA